MHNPNTNQSSSASSSLKLKAEIKAHIEAFAKARRPEKGRRIPLTARVRSWAIEQKERLADDLVQIIEAGHSFAGLEPRGIRDNVRLTLVSGGKTDECEVIELFGDLPEAA